MSTWPEQSPGTQTKPDPIPRDGREKDWDDFQRPRQPWDQNDRDIPPYPERPPGDAVRGRSRSPPGDETRKRRRSPSPWDRSRHDPRPRYGDDRDFRRDDFGRRGGHGYGGRDGRGPRPAPQNPFEQDAPAQLKQFAEWFRYTQPEQATEEDRLDAEALRESGREGPKPRDGIRARWEKYKKDFAAEQVNIMFEYHKKSPWFAEKYNPSEEFVRLRQRVRKEGWKGRLGQFLLELDEGKHDPEMTFGVVSAPANGGMSSPKTIVSPVVETPTKESIVGEELPKIKNEDEDMTFGLDNEDDAAENDQKNDAGSKSQFDGRRSSTRDDGISVMPEGNEVMIRTIPPDIGRVKLEEVCSSVTGFMHLALGEPLQKRNFYRAGWIRLQDDTDMEKAVQELGEKKVDGFKLHVTHTTRPFVTRVRVTPDVASRPERIKKDVAQIKQLASILEEEAGVLRRFSPTRARKAAERAAAASKNGDDSADPTSPKTEEDNSMDQVPDVEVDPDVEVEIEPEPKEKPSEAVERRIEKLIADLQEQSSASELEDGIGWEAKKDTIALDLYRQYLRAAFNTCYYCAAITDHVEELQRKCVLHRRKPLSQKTLEEITAAKKVAEEDADMEKGGEVEVKTEGDGGEKPREKNTESREWKRNDERWLDWLDGKMALLVNKAEVDPRDYAGKNPDEELTKVCQAHIKQEDEGKYRCKQCNKLFKAMSFVEKHVANKHPELVKHLDDLVYYNNFALDPHRIQAFTHPPPTVGGGNQGPPPQAYGLKGHFTMPPPVVDFAHGRGGYGPYPYPPPPGVYGGYPPPPPPYYDAWAHVPYPPAYLASMVDTAVGGGGRGGGRLRDRLGGFAELPMNVDNLPPKPGMFAGGPRAPPPDAREDPRASGGRKISYHDIDRAAVGDDVNVELSY